MNDPHSKLMVLADDYAADACGGADPTEFSARRRDALSAALREVVVDAERYRWMRRFDHFAQVDAMLDTTEFNTLDAAIDSARSTK